MVSKSSITTKANPIYPSLGLYVRSVETVKVIKVRTFAGTGSSEDAKRAVVQYWTEDGVLLVEIDDL